MRVWECMRAYSVCVWVCTSGGGEQRGGPGGVEVGAGSVRAQAQGGVDPPGPAHHAAHVTQLAYATVDQVGRGRRSRRDRKSTRLNSSHL